MSFCIKNTSPNSFISTLAPKEENHILKNNKPKVKEVLIFNAYDKITQNNSLSGASVLIFNNETKSWCQKTDT